MTVSVGLIGCGAVSSMMYGPTLARLGGEGLIRTTAVVDPNPSRTAELQAQLPGARAFATIDQMLGAEPPELAIIAAPHQYHADMAEACLSRGIAVLCEKPMAMSTAECDRMIEAAARTQTALAVAHFRRFFWSCQAIKHILESGNLGRVTSFSFLEGDAYAWPAVSASYFDRKQAGGGVLIDAGAHMIDLLLWWLGEVETLSYADDAMGGVEANCLLRLRMKGGASGTIQLSRDWPLPNRYLIQCERGWVAYICDVVDRIEYGFEGVQIGFDARLRETTASPVFPRVLGAPAPDFNACFDEQLRHLVTAVRTKGAVAVSGVDARKTVAFIEECYRNRQPIAMPWLDPEEQTRARELSHV